MKTEPDLIDIYAMFIVMGLMQKPHKTLKSKIDIEQAQAMVEVREDFINKRGD